MYLQKISLVNFKNYSHLDFQFVSKLNCFIGNNGVGKTNLLDAVFYLSMCKSFFNSIDSQNIKHDEDFFIIQGEYDKDGEEENVYCGFKKNKGKIFKRNKKVYERLADHIGLFPIVMVSPSDSSLILEGSEERRKFIDSVISQYDKIYLDCLMRYNRALEQRNKLLKNFAATNTFDSSLIEIWDEQLINNGLKIHEKRIKFIEKLLPIFQNYYQFVSLGNETVDLIYDSSLNHSNLRDLLSETLLKDRILGYTTTGIHKDDLLLMLGNYPIKKIGSQGQQKTYLISLKLAQFDFVKEINGYKPIILLDDIFDKLDATRVKQIIKLVSDNHFGQIFITDTSTERLKKIVSEINIENKVFEITKTME